MIPGVHWHGTFSVLCSSTAAGRPTTCQKSLQIPAVGRGNSLTLLLAGQDLNLQDKGTDRMLMTAIDLDIEAEVPHFSGQKCSLGLANLMAPCWRRLCIYSLNNTCHSVHN